MQINGGDLNAYPSNFTVTFSNSALHHYKMVLVTKHLRYPTLSSLYIRNRTLVLQIKRYENSSLLQGLDCPDSPQGISGVAFGTFGVAQTINYLTDGGVQYVDTIEYLCNW